MGWSCLHSTWRINSILERGGHNVLAHQCAVSNVCVCVCALGVCLRMDLSTECTERAGQNVVRLVSFEVEAVVH